MWTGFTIQFRPTEDEPVCLYWKPMEYISVYNWVWKDRVYPNGCGACIILSNNTCLLCDTPIEKNKIYCSFACKVNDCGCQASYSCCGED